MQSQENLLIEIMKDYSSRRRKFIIIWLEETHLTCYFVNAFLDASLEPVKLYLMFEMIFPGKMLYFSVLKRRIS